MSLDITLSAIRRTPVFEVNVTHNLGRMANEAGLYEVMWHPEEIGVLTAAQAIPLLEAGLAKLRAFPDEFKKHDPPNGWCSYDGLVSDVEAYLSACRANPDAEIEANR